MDKVLVILNPAARSTKARSLQKKIAALSPRVVIRVTRAPGDAEAIAERGVEQGFKTIVAAGGDGTINEVINGIAQADVALGILPVGTMNVFAAEIGLPSNQLRKCWKIIEDGHLRKIDLARANDHYFIQMAGVGLDAQVVQETSWEAKKNFGPLSYLFSATQIAARKPPNLRVTTETKEVVEGSFVLVGNGRFYGGPFVLCKEAKINDGKLDILIFQNLGYLDIIRYLQGILFGTHTKMKDVVYLKSRRFSVDSTETVPVEVDGELLGNLPVTFRIVSTRLKVFAPAPKPGQRPKS